MMYQSGVDSTSFRNQAGTAPGGGGSVIPCFFIRFSAQRGTRGAISLITFASLNQEPEPRLQVASKARATPPSTPAASPSAIGRTFVAPGGKYSTRRAA